MWRVSEANESQASYSVEQADIFQYHSHSDDMFIILKSNINTDTSIFVFSREKSHGTYLGNTIFSLFCSSFDCKTKVSSANQVNLKRGRCYI
jgi:hypothetical protein